MVSITTFHMNLKIRPNNNLLNSNVFYGVDLIIKFVFLCKFLGKKRSFLMYLENSLNNIKML